MFYEVIENECGNLFAAQRFNPDTEQYETSPFFASRAKAEEIADLWNESLIQYGDD